MTNIRKLTTSKLIAACLDGEAGAWDTLVERYQDYVFTIVARHLATADERKDAFQNVFLLLYGNLKRLRNHEKLASYLFQITRRECLRIIREVGREADRAPSIMEGLGYRKQSETPESFFIRLEEQMLIRNAVRMLPSRCRTIIERLFFEPEPLSYEELAQELGVPTASIGPYRQRCLWRLRKNLEKLGVL
jgi:RNA polymerase sigma-70 factor (ECF subfamily)